MMYKKITFLLGVVLVFSISCKKSNHVTPLTNDPGSSKGVKVISEQTWKNNFVSLDSSNYTLTFSKGLASTNTLQVGDIIVSSVGEGFLRKVKAVSAANNTIQIQTEQAFLTEVIKDGTVKFDELLSSQKIARIQSLYEGVKIVRNNDKSFTSFPIEINAVLYDVDKNPDTKNDQIKIVGSFNCDWHITGLIDVGITSGLKEVKFSFESNESIDLQLIAGLQYNFDKKITLATVTFAPIVVTVGAIPVVFTPIFDIVVGTNGYANSSLTSQIGQSLSFNAGVHWLKVSGWTPFQTYTKSFSFQPPLLNVNAGAQVYIKPELTLKVYGVAGPFVNAKVYGKLDADVLQTPWWKLYGGVTMNAGAKVNIIDQILLEFTVSDLINFENLLAQSKLPPASLPKVSTHSITDISQNSAIGGGEITNDGNATIIERGIVYSTYQAPTTADIKIPVSSNSSSFTAYILGLKPNTPYYVRAYATNSQGTAYGDQVAFMTSPSLTLATVTTAAVTNAFSVYATMGGNVMLDGNTTVTERGVVYATTQNPTTSNSKIAIGTGKGSFSYSVMGLTPNTTYYVRAYAINSQGTAYGDQVSFTTGQGWALPTVTTTAATNITNSSATLGGNVTSDGNATVTERGIVYANTQNPTTANNRVANGSGIGIFSSNVSGLTPGTTYYVRAYAINSQGTTYGTQISFTASQNLSTPTVSTSVATNITSNTVTLGGNVTNDGNAVITERGVVYATTQNPTISNTKVANGTGTGSFTSNIAGLIPGTTYFVRAYAINSQGISYGTQVSFTAGQAPLLPTVTTTQANNVTTNGATLGGNVTNDGNSSVTERGIVYSATTVPTTSTGTKIQIGSGTGIFSANISGFTSGTLYSVRAYAINSQGTAYGDLITFTPGQLYSLATVTTIAVSNITNNTATLGGNVTSDGNSSVTERGVVYATTQYPTTSNTKVTNGTGTGSFTSNIAGFSPGTTYYVRAYAINSQGIAYGSQVSFTASQALSTATVTTATATNITSYTVTLGGNVTNDGNAAVTERGVVYATTQNPTTSNTKVTNGTGTGSFTSNIAGFSPGTTYYVRAYAINSQGTSYGTQISFTTSQVLSTATVSTSAATNITSNTVTLGGNVTNDGNAAVTERGVVYATTQNPTTSNTKVTNGTGTGSFTSNIAGLNPGTTYYARAYAINSQGTAYGTQVSFATAAGLITGTVSDLDGNTYSTVNIGTQVWMSENLYTTKYNDGTSIANVSDNAAWGALATGALCWYNNDAATYKATYGALYNWYSVNTGKLCPTGWHVPDDSEWTILTTFLGGESVAGGKMKEIGTSHWLAPNAGATNSSGFTALPGGVRGSNGVLFMGLGEEGRYWSSTPSAIIAGDAVLRAVGLLNSVVSNYTDYKKCGLSVRCVKN